jgi:hypothetical protein
MAPNGAFVENPPMQRPADRTTVTPPSDLSRRSQWNPATLKTSGDLHNKCAARDSGAIKSKALQVLVAIDQSAILVHQPGNAAG